MVFPIPSVISSSIAMLCLLLPPSLSSSLLDTNSHPLPSTINRLDESRLELEIGMNLVFFGLLGITFIYLGMLIVPGKDLLENPNRNLMRTDFRNQLLPDIEMILLSS